MPLYEYQCEACGNRFEKLQKFSDPPVDTCPSCGGRVRKLVSSPAFQFKGTGWYVTDYARSGEQKAPGADSSDGTAETAKAASSAEKPDKSEKPSDKGTTTDAAPAVKSDVKPST